MINSQTDGTKTSAGKLAKELIAEHLCNIDWVALHEWSAELTAREENMVREQVQAWVKRLCGKLGREVTGHIAVDGKNGHVYAQEIELEETGS